MSNRKKQALTQGKSENYIFTYYQKIMDGSIPASKWVKLLYAYLVHGLEEKQFFFDAKKAHHAIDWIEAHCFHVEGRLATKPLLLELYEKAALSALFGIVDANGLRQFREVFWVTARKSGKSLDAAAISRYIWKNEGFGTKVFNIAPKLEQADIVYQNIWTMTQLDPEYIAKKEKQGERDSSKRKVNPEDPTLERHRMTDLYIPATNATVKKIAFSAKKSDGFNPSICVCDEVAAWDAEKGLKQYEVIKSGTGAREEPIVLSITTAGYINDGIYDELMKRATRFLKGESKERRLLPIIYQIDDISKWNDINELYKANPKLGVSVSVDFMLEEIAIAEGSLSKRSEFLCKYCNIKQNSSQAWLDAETIEKTVCAPYSLEDFHDTYCVMGIDLSRTTDLTAAVVVVEKEGVLYTFARFYLPSEKIDEATARDGLPYRSFIQRGLLFPSGENFIDYHDVEDWIYELIRDYHIYPLKVGYDRYCASYLVQDLTEEGVHMDDVYQGENLTPVIRETEGLMRDGKIRIGDNDLLKAHFYNSALKVNAETERMRLVKLEQKVHIDGMAAFLDAMTVRQKWFSEIGEQLKNERRFCNESV